MVRNRRALEKAKEEGHVICKKKEDQFYTKRAVHTHTQILKWGAQVPDRKGKFGAAWKKRDDWTYSEPPHCNWIIETQQVYSLVNQMLRIHLEVEEEPDMRIIFIAFFIWGKKWWGMSSIV